MALTLDPTTDVLPAVQALMVERTRAEAAWGSDALGAKGGGRLLGHFSDGTGTAPDLAGEPATRPNRTQAMNVIDRMAGIVSRSYPAAEEGDRPWMVDRAALMAGIRLETMFYAEQVVAERSPARLWMDLLAAMDADTAAGGGGGGGDPGNPAGLAAYNGFGGCGCLGACGCRAEGAETPLWPGSAYPWPYRNPACVVPPPC